MPKSQFPVKCPSCGGGVDGPVKSEYGKGNVKMTWRCPSCRYEWEIVGKSPISGAPEQ